MLIDLGPMAEGTKLSNLVIGTRDTLSTLYLGEGGTTANKNIEVFEHFVFHLSGLTPFPIRFFHSVPRSTRSIFTVPSAS